MRGILGLTVLLTLGIGYSIFLVAELFIERKKAKKMESEEIKTKDLVFYDVGWDWVKSGIDPPDNDIKLLEIKYSGLELGVYYNGKRLVDSPLIEKINMTSQKITITVKEKYDNTFR